jgi:hypothetical protein
MPSASVPEDNRTNWLQDAENTSVTISEIVADDQIQARVGLNQQVVAEYAEAMVAGATFPPVVVFRDAEGKHWLADGFHRYFAAQQTGKAGLPTEIHEGTRRDALLYACGANATHGLRRTREDTHKAVTILLRDHEWAQWSDREIARYCGVDHKTVAIYRRRLSGEIPQMRTVQRGETTYTMDTTRIGKSTALAAEYIDQSDSDAPVGVPEEIEQMGAALGAVRVMADHFHAQKAQDQADERERQRRLREDAPVQTPHVTPQPVEGQLLAGYSQRQTLLYILKDAWTKATPETRRIFRHWIDTAQ